MIWPRRERVARERVRGWRAERPHGYKSLEREARLVREILGLGSDEPVPPGIELFERLGRLGRLVGGNVTYEVVKTTSNALEGLARWDEQKKKYFVGLSERTYEALERDDGRARFSLAHEIGHVRCHSSLLKTLSRIPHEQASALRRGAAKHEICMDTEWQADTFAGALLVPAKGLKNLSRTAELTPQLISATFKVSFEAAQHRLRTFTARQTELVYA